MKRTQGNSLCSYLYLKLAKTSCFYLFSSTKSENRLAEQVLGGGGIGTGGKEEVAGKGGRRMNTVHIMCTHLCECKMIPVETVSGMRE
jgi:hypothetical protein